MTIPIPARLRTLPASERPDLLFHAHSLTIIFDYSSDEEDHKRKCPSRKHRKHKGAVQKPKYVANPAIYGGHTPEENMFQMAGTAGSSSLPATASAGAEDDSDDDADTEADRLE